MSVVALSLVMGLTLQDPPIAEDTREVTLGHFKPLAVLDIELSLRLQSWTYSLYAPFSGPPQQGGRRYLAWRRLSKHRLQPPVVEWARVDTCPGAEAVLVQMEEMPLPRVDVPLLGRDDRQGPPLDGVSYELWFRYGTWPDGFAYAASVHSNIGTPLATWSERFVSVMEPCWTSEAPPAWDSAAR